VRDQPPRALSLADQACDLVTKPDDQYLRAYDASKVIEILAAAEGNALAASVRRLLATMLSPHWEEMLPTLAQVDPRAVTTLSKFVLDVIMGTSQPHDW
jgi:hypothetical protein